MPLTETEAGLLKYMLKIRDQSGNLIRSLRFFVIFSLLFLTQLKLFCSISGMETCPLELRESCVLDYFAFFSNVWHLPFMDPSVGFGCQSHF